MVKHARGNRVALVTGASSGIGQSIALALLKEGYVVYGAARRVEKMEAIRAAGGRVIGMDVADTESVDAGVRQVLAERQRVDVLVNAAGYGQYGAIEDMPMADARRQFDVNVFGGAGLIRKVLPGMRERGFGKIVNVTSVGGKIHTPMGGWYHASKFAMEGYSDVLRVEVRPFGIDVIVIEPGIIATQWGDIAIDEARRLSGSGPYRALLDKYVRIQREAKGSPPDVIARLTVKALGAARPKARYHAGAMAGPVLFLRWLLPDAMFDRLVMAPFARVKN